MFRAPGFSHPSVPPVVRAGLALVLTIGIVPAVHVARAGSGLAFVFALAAEAATGAAIGFGAAVLYDGAYAAGRALDDYVGIRGSVPGIGIAAAGGFGRIWSLVFLAAFFLLDGYRWLILVFADDFTRLPPGVLLQPAALRAFAIAVPALILKAAVEIAGPAIGLVFLAQFGLGALSRAIPRFASFTLSFPVVFGVALIVTMLMVPALLDAGARPWIPGP